MSERPCDQCGQKFDPENYGLIGRGKTFCSFKCCDDWQDEQGEKEQANKSPKDSADV